MSTTSIDGHDRPDTEEPAPPRRAADAIVRDVVRDSVDALTTRRVFGEPHEVDGVTVIPVARVGGGAGGGGGEGTTRDDNGSGLGAGLGIRVEPVGVYEISAGHVRWRPAVDVTRLARRAMGLAALVVVCRTLVRLRRRS